MNRKKFGEIMFKAREKEGITLRKLGQMVGMKPSHLSSIERGKSLPPSDGIVLSLAIALSTSWKELADAAKMDADEAKKGA